MSIPLSEIPLKTLYKVDKNIQYYQKSEQRLEAYQKNQSPKHKARDDDFEI